MADDRGEMPAHGRTPVSALRGTPKSIDSLIVLIAAVAAGFCGAVAVGLVLGPRLGAVAAGLLALLDAALVASALAKRQAASPMSQRFERGFDDAAIGMMVLTQKLHVIRANDTLCAMLERGADELIGHSILEFTHPDDVKRSIDKREQMRHGDDHGELVKRYFRPDGTTLHAVVTTALVEPGDAEPYFFSQLKDVTEQYRAQRQKALIADLGRRALESADAIMLMGEAVRMVREVLGTASCIVTRRQTNGTVRLVAADGETVGPTIPAGLPSQTGHTLLGNEPVFSNDLAHEMRFAVPAAITDRGLSRGLSVPVPERAGRRHVIITHSHASERPFTHDDTRFLEAVAHVIAGALDREASEQELRRRALEDPLTGLANRALLSQQLEAELRHARRLGDQVCVLVLDLDRFKMVNDTLGHGAGDALLRRVAARLTNCVREEDLVARPGGDEFTVVCARTDTDHAIADVAQRLVDAVVEPFDDDGREVFVTVSIGVAVSERGAETAEELLRDADAAMYRAKELGGGRFELFNATLRSRLVERMAIEGDLRHAVERDQLELYYQPLVDLETDQLLGFEALLRWRHPDRGLIQPSDFIPIAEETGMIVPIGLWVLHRVCDQLAQWPDEIRVSANLSPLQVRRELIAEVKEQLDRHAVTPERLVLEITERLVLDPRTKPVVAGLRALGVQLALDDFGTGYSSLGSLQRFPLDVVKLDRTLISSLNECNGIAIVRAAVELGQALNMRVIAEGIEGSVQLDALRELGCPIGQGFLFARPLPLAEAQRLVDGSSAHGQAA